MMAHIYMVFIWCNLSLDNTIGTFVSNNLNYFNDKAKLNVVFSLQEEHHRSNFYLEFFFLLIFLGLKNNLIYAKAAKVLG
jgi:hypothetical protein